MKPATLDYINRVVAGLQNAVGMVRDDGREAEASQDHISVIRHFNDLRLAMAQIKEARQALDEMEELFSREIVPNSMKANGVKTVTVEGVGRVTVSHRFSCSILDKPLGFNWLRENGHGGLIQETVNSSTLGAFARNLIEEQGIELPPDIFKTSTMPYTSITKVK